MGVLDGKYIYNIDRVTNDVVVVKSTLSPTYSATIYVPYKRRKNKERILKAVSFHLCNINNY